MDKPIQVLTHQNDFIEDITTRHLALVGGYGCGKTHTFCLKAMHLASLNIGYEGVLLEPTFSMVEDTLLPQFEDLLNLHEIPYTLKKAPAPAFTLYFEGGTSVVKLRSAENYRRLAGLNLAWAGIDEADTIKPAIIDACWKMCQSRLRRGNIYQLFTTSTPEGFGFLYNYFEKNGDENGDRRLIRARTTDNPFLPQEYIDSLFADYPPELIKSYLNGEFTNLTSGTVYTSFDREKSHTDYDYEWVLDYEKRNPHDAKFIFHVGQDFNVGKCYSAIHIIIDNIPYAIAELAESKNTEVVINRIQELYPDRRIIMYPDSSGKNERSNASQTDITLLKNAGFQPSYPTKNPFIRDRVGSVNAMLLNAKQERRYFINTTKCPVLTEALEQQVYDKNGLPDKMHDNDHPPDAVGYFIHRKYPLKRANAKQIKMIGL